MSNRKNHRRGEERRTETGPRWENPDPGHGCNSGHVAKARHSRRALGRRAERRTGKRGANSVMYMVGAGQVLPSEEEE